MIQKIKNQNISYKAFTLVEMVIVLVIIWIMLMSTVFLSWEQIQKVKDKTVKESILAEMQTRYSRNLWSSSFAWKIYDSMDVSFSGWSNEIRFKYETKDGEEPENIFTDKFEMKYLTTGYHYEWTPTPVNNIELKYYPYKISCKIWDSESSSGDNLVFIARVNNNKDYCFEINQKNCRLVEVSESKCTILKCRAWFDNCSA